MTQPPKVNRRLTIMSSSEKNKIKIDQKKYSLPPIINEPSPGKSDWTLATNCSASSIALHRIVD